MLVVVGIDTRIDFSAPALGVFAGIHRVGVQDSCELDFELNCTIQVKDPVHAVFVVSGRENV